MIYMSLGNKDHIIAIAIVIVIVIFLTRLYLLRVLNFNHLTMQEITSCDYHRETSTKNI